MAPDPPSSRRWRRILAIADAVLDAPVEDRAAAVQRACGGDSQLQGEVERFLEAGDRTDGFLDTPPVALPWRIGRYRVERLLGRGGMGIVYLARDPVLERPVALKLLPPFLALDPEAKQRFVDEAKAASALDHPHVATVYEIGETAGGRLFIAMAYYEGETLKDRLQRGPMTGEEVAELGAQIAEGLAAVHDKGILHGDIKPGNIVVTPDGIATIVDFGIAKALGGASARTGPRHGTVAYMSPEQTRGQRLDERSDLWSLGIVLYEMSTGVRPFRGDDAQTVTSAVRGDEPEPVRELRPELPPVLGDTVRRCLAKDPSDRYQNARDLLRDLTPFRPHGSAVGSAAIARRGPAGAWRRASRRAKAMIGAGAGIILFAVIGVLADGPPGREHPQVAPASAIAVLPPVPVATDSALARLGKELAITLSASLDGIGRIRTTPALTVLANAEEPVLSLEHGARVARRLGARSALHGSLLRKGEDVRLDVVLFEVDDLRPLAEATVEGPADDIGALTDSVSLALLRLIWDDGPVPARSLSKLTTASVPALRAFLEGEAAYARGAYPEAISAYERAFGEDSTFWFAYWRSLYPRSHVGPPPDGEALAAAFEHRDELPERERLLVESYRVKTLRERIAVLRRLAERFPDYWPGWWEYAEELTHRGPYVGATHRDTRTALDRTLALNPGFAAGWEHLFWVAVLERDSATVSRSRARLERFASPGAFRFNSDMLPYLRALEEVLGGGGEFGEGGAGRIARAILAMQAGGAPIRTEAFATGFVSFGFPRAQLQLADAILAEGAAGELATAQAWGRALSWAVRGAWSEALAESDRWAAESALPTAGLRAYGLAAVGAWMGAVSPQAAAERRDLAASSQAARTPEGRAELAWLDGVFAYLLNDEPGLARAIGTLQTGGAAPLGRLRRSLDAFLRDMRGDREGAARTLAALEEESSSGLESRYRPDQQAPRHPHLSAVNRLASSSWLLEIGDTARAERLLTWHQAIGPMDQAELINRTAEPLAILMRARIAESRGREQVGQKLYAAFLERYDIPSATHVSWVEEARGALRRLSAAAESGR